MQVPTNRLLHRLAITAFAASLGALGCGQAQDAGAGKGDSGPGDSDQFGSVEDVQASADAPTDGEPGDAAIEADGDGVAAADPGPGEVTDALVAEDVADTPDTDAAETGTAGTDVADATLPDTLDTGADAIAVLPGPASPCDASVMCPAGLVCDTAAHACVACLGNGDCASGSVCWGQACVVGALCKSDKDCKSSGQVCLVAQGVCVACVKDADCDAGSTCANHQCAQVKTCKSSKDCPGVCDEGSGQCVDCVADGDCANGEYCATAEHVCKAAICASHVCAGGSWFACKANGSGFLAAQPCDDGSVCTSDACDIVSGCVYLAGAVSCSDGNPCTADSCDGKKGCTHVDENGACDDGSACTAQDACASGGTCKGVPLACGDDNPCTADGCDPAQGCIHTPLDGAACDADGNACTLGDACQGSKCAVGTAKTCPAQGPCVTGTCENKTGNCAYSPSSGACDDGSACTSADTCADGACVGKVTACDDANPCTADGCDAKKGCTHAALEGKSCNADDDACTALDSCQAGTCVAGAKKTCQDQGPCVVSSCDAKTGNCAFAAKDGSCDDGDACTNGDTCAGGACMPGVAKACDDKNPCTKDACDAKGECTFNPAIGACNDGNPCTANDACQSGQCQGQAVDVKVVCDDANPCTTDGCSPLSGCTHLAKSGQLCDDTNPCTTGDACDAKGQCLGLSGACACLNDGDCAQASGGNACLGSPYCDKAQAPYTCKIKPGTAVQCDTSGDGPCVSTACDPKTGKCAPTAKNEGGPCDDGSTCSQQDLCKAGLCNAGAQKVCDDSNPCTKDSCDAKLGCQTQAASGSCDDGNACTTSDVCSSGLCKAGGVLTCDDGKPCTSDTCDPKAGCKFTAATGSCSDADACTSGETCIGDACQGGKPVACTDGNSCTNDSCDPKSGCVFKALETGSCDDGSNCTTSDACQGGTCKGVAKSCDDGNACTSDACDPKDGCKNTVANGTCSDGNPCTSGDACSDGKCVAGQATVCDDSDPCTVETCASPSGCVVTGKPDCKDDSSCTYDYCKAGSGCAHTAEIGGCEDGDPCTQGESCKFGACTGGSAKDCDDKDGCTKDSCDAQKGCVATPLTGAPCDDGDSCTGQDQCQAGLCKGVATQDCNDNNPCTKDTCAAGGCQPTAVADGTGCGNGLVCKAGACLKACVGDSTCPSGCMCGSGTCQYKPWTNDGVLPFSPGMHTAYHPFLDEYWVAETASPTQKITRYSIAGQQIGSFMVSFSGIAGWNVNDLACDTQSSDFYLLVVAGSNTNLVRLKMTGEMVWTKGTYEWSCGTPAIFVNDFFVYSYYACSNSKNMALWRKKTDGAPASNADAYTGLQAPQGGTFLGADALILLSGAVARYQVDGNGGFKPQVTENKGVTGNSTFILARGKRVCVGASGWSTCYAMEMPCL